MNLQSKKAIFFVLITGLMTACLDKKQDISLLELHNSLEVSNFYEDYRNYGNSHRRNCIYYFEKPNDTYCIYTLEENGVIGINRLDSSINDSLAIIEEIKGVLLNQEKLGIKSFYSDTGKIRVIFDLDNIQDEPQIISNNIDSKIKYGSLIYLFNNNPRSIRDEGAVKVKSNLYFAPYPKPNTKSDCN